MTQIDFVILLIAGILGTIGASTNARNHTIYFGWLIFTVWVILKLAHVF